MFTNNRVIWSEGMLLTPQHFQQQNRYLENLVHRKPTALDPYGWGFSELSISNEALELGKLSLLSCNGVLPDGTIFDVPGNDPTPEPMNIPEGLSNTLIYLGVPLRQANIADSGYKKAHQSYRHHIMHHEIMDNIADSKQSTDVQVGELALRLLTSHDDLANYAAMPVVFIKECQSSKKIILEKNFIQPCLELQASNVLMAQVEKIHELLYHRAEMLSYRLTDTQQSATAEIIDFILLQLANRFEGILAHIKEEKTVHPRSLYELLLSLMNELATFTSHNRRPIKVNPYKHDQLAETFKLLIDEICRSLSIVLEQNSQAIHLEKQQYGIWAGKILEPELLDSSNFVLAVYADMSAETVRQSLPKHIKVAPVEQIRTLVSRALPGIDIQPMPVAPRQIPYHANFSYFLLNRQHEYWPFLKKSGGIAFHVGGSFPGLKLELWAIRV